MHQKFDEATGDASLDDCLDLVVGAIREVRNCPACIDENFVVERIYELSKHRECGSDLTGSARCWLKHSCVHLRSASQAEVSCHDRSCSGSM